MTHIPLIGETRLGQTVELGFGYVSRAQYASHPEHSRGRAIAERESPTRSCFQRDRDRIIHSNAFRRLKHKTQVFIADEGDHYRTRLTHSIEVAQIARAIARALRLDEDLTEALALAHDFGHTPFGHAGERALNEMMMEFGGFDHNLQSLKTVVKLEHRYPLFDGLNLSWETLEGLAKHNGPVPDHLVEKIYDLVPEMDLDLAGHASLEAQAAAIADDIAYNTHDIDDGLRSGILALEDLTQVPLLNKILHKIDDDFQNLDERRKRYELLRRLITQMVEDVIETARDTLQSLNASDSDAVRAAGKTVVKFSAAMARQELELKAFLYAKLYRNPDLMVQMEEAEALVRELFELFMSDFDRVPDQWRFRSVRGGRHLSEPRRARIIADYIAGMTDFFARKEHARLST